MPRVKQHRKEGAYGFGRYADEPWSLSAIEKRRDSLKDFYKHVLRGTSHENPANAPLVKCYMTMLRLVIGSQVTHVPQVCAGVGGGAGEGWSGWSHLSTIAECCDTVALLSVHRHSMRSSSRR